MDDVKNGTIEQGSGEEIKAASAASDAAPGEPKEEGGRKSRSKRNKKVEELERKVKDLEEQLARAVADYRNLEKRFDEEKREFVKYANRDLLLRIIPAFDTLFLAEKYVADEGIKLTIKHLQESLKDVGVERVKTVGEMFDAGLMEAVTTEEGEDNKVLEELRPGYTLNGKLIRPAQVEVGKSGN